MSTKNKNPEHIKSILGRVFTQIALVYEKRMSVIDEGKANFPRDIRHKVDFILED